jgi:aryl-alcohol dehydrogenase-like predicted oxidoreductase
MEYRKLGNSGIDVSVLCLGTLLFSGPTNRTVSERIIGLAADNGVNFIDTAEGYQNGGSEKMVGALIRKRRHDWILATKAGSYRAKPPGFLGLSRKWLMHGVDESLRRLGTDHIDLYYCHNDDFGTPQEETAAAMGDLIRAGKVRYWGLSNYYAWRMTRMVDIADRLSVPRPVALQPYYNAMNRGPEVEMLPAASALGLGAVPYSPLARGVLTGKYQPGKAPAKGTRAGTGDPRMMEAEFRKESLRIAQRVVAHAKKVGTTPGQLAFGWVLNNQAVTAALAGPRTVAQFRDYLKAVAYDFTAADEAFFNRQVAPGHPSTPGFTDPKFPIRGRETFTA